MGHQYYQWADSVLQSKKRRESGSDHAISTLGFEKKSVREQFTDRVGRLKVLHSRSIVEQRDDVGVDNAR